MSDEAEPGDSDLRRRAAWLLTMLVVVAALVVALTVWLLRPGSSKNNDAGPGIDDPSSTSASAGPSSTGPANRSGSTSPGTANSSASSSAPTKVPKPDCPSSATCTVTGDISGAASAINAYRAKNGKSAVPATTSTTADMCALSSGSDCPTSFVWVHVSNLSGKSVVQSVLGYHSSDDLLDNTAKAFQIGWAYDPAGEVSLLRGHPRRLIRSSTERRRAGATARHIPLGSATSVGCLVGLNRPRVLRIEREILWAST